jgi:hypothetical protein
MELFSMGIKFQKVNLDEIQVADCYFVFIVVRVMLKLPLVEDYWICQNNGLGKGTFATVKLAICTVSGQRFACKVISKRIIGKAAFRARNQYSIQI